MGLWADMLKLIQTTVLSTSAASVTISNIPQQFKTLKLLCSIRTSGSESTGNAYASISFNGSSANFTRRSFYGNGTNATVGSGTGTTSIATADSSANAANTFSNVEVIIPNYSGSTNKAFIDNGVNEENATNASQIFAANLWSNTAAITSITLTGVSNLAAGSTFYLYGIA